MTKTYYVVDNDAESALTMSPEHTDPMEAMAELNRLKVSNKESVWKIYRIERTAAEVEFVLVPKDAITKNNLG